MLADPPARPRFQSLSRALLIALALAAGPALADRDVTGTAGYPQRIALPEGAELVVELRNEAGTVVALARRPTGGAQVPLPFAITAPAPEGDAPATPLVLQVAVLQDGAPIWVSDPLPLPPEGEAMAPVRLRPWQPMGFATRFRCGELPVELGFVDPIARLRIGDRFLDLTPAPAASGAKFVAGGGEDSFAWTKGEGMLLRLQGAAFPECRKEAPGEAPFRAGGSEPGWSLTLDADGARWSGRYGEVTRETALPLPLPGPEGARRYDLAPDLTVTVADALCRDAATGMPHPATVSATFEDDTMQGCGGSPMALLAGADWRVEDIAGRGLPDDAMATVGFHGGRATGQTGCNAFTGALDLTGEALRFGPMAMTRRACAPALTRLEADMMSALQETDRFDIAPDGALTLMAGDKTLMLLRR